MTNVELRSTSPVEDAAPASSMSTNRRPARRVLMVTPHFPPDTSAATHRVRLLAPYLAQFGWQPTVLTVERSANEGRQDPELERMVPEDLRIVRAPAWNAKWTRKLGVGDLGLRAFTGLYGEAARLLKSEKYDALFITIFPSYPAVLGPLLKSRFGLAFVLDYQDPWVGAWGKSVGGGKGGKADVKSRLTRLAGSRLEPFAVHAADAITAVSAGTYEMLRERFPEVERIPCVAIPIGGDERDFTALRKRPRENKWYDSEDGDFHICYIGTLLPLGFETLRAVLSAVAHLRKTSPRVYERVRLHFFGTSNQTAGNPQPRVLPVASEYGVEDRVTEIPLRIDYLDALTVQADASAILLMGSSEPHYTASKLYPALLAGRPILGVYHSRSSVAEIMQRVTSPPAAHLITYSETDPPSNRIDAIADALRSLIEHPARETVTWPHDELEKFSARSLAGDLARVLDLAVDAKQAHSTRRTGRRPWA